MKLLLIFVATVFFLNAAAADCQDTSGIFRKYFDKTNAPLAMVYHIFVQSIFADSLDYLEDLDSLGDEEYHAGRHFVEAGITPNMSSADVVRYFVQKFLEIEEESQEAQKRTFCIDGKPRYQGAENFVVFNQLEEVNLNVYEKYYLIARSDLQASGLFDLDKALEEFPGTFGSKFMDHEKAHDGSEKGIYEVAVGSCKVPWGTVLVRANL